VGAALVGQRTGSRWQLLKCRHAWLPPGAYCGPRVKCEWCLQWCRPVALSRSYPVPALELGPAPSLRCAASCGHSCLWPPFQCATCNGQGATVQQASSLRVLPACSVQPCGLDTSKMGLPQRQVPLQSCAAKLAVALQVRCPAAQHSPPGTWHSREQYWAVRQVLQRFRCKPACLEARARTDRHRWAQVGGLLHTILPRGRKLPACWLSQRQGAPLARTAPTMCTN